MVTSSPPITVTARELVFFDDGQQVTIPAGTECKIYNRQTHSRHADVAEDLLAKAQRANRGTSGYRHLVMMLNGRPRLLNCRTDTTTAEAFKRQQAAVAEPATAAPPPAPAVPRPQRQKALF